MRETIRNLLGNHRPAGIDRADLVPASVLLPFYDLNDRVHLVFTERTHQVEYHKGQISFPGGVRERSDHSVVATALREAEEEVGIPPGRVDVLGLLDDLVTPTGFRITPVAGWIPADLSLEAHPKEVEQILHVPLDHLRDEDNFRTELWKTDNGEREVYFYDWKGRVIWGVTGAILKNFLDILGRGGRSGATCRES